VTVVEALARAASGPRGVVLLGQRDGERRLGWAEVAERAAQAAGALAAAGLRPGDRLLLALNTGEDWLALFFGALRLGAIPCPVSPPLGLGARAAFARRIVQLALVVAARAVVTTTEEAAALEGALAPSTARWSPEGLRAAATATAPGREPAPDEPAFVQFTSGTTSGAKGVVIPHRAVVANVEQIGEATDIDAGAVVVSWLPLHHDMGLVGGLLTALLRGVDLALGTPFGFVRRPASWLEALSRHRGTHSPAPTFAYRTVVERVAPADLAGLDLSPWRAAFVGAEQVQLDVLQAFAAKLAPCGLREGALLPCYGLAEASLAVTCHAPGRPPRARTVSRRGLATDGAVHAPTSPADARVVVSCGPPLRGTTVRVVDPQGRDLPEGRQGEVVVDGPSLTPGYFGEPPRASALATGDLGFLDGGALHVTGRTKDVVILNGENHSPAEVEWAAARAPGVRGRVAAFGVSETDDASRAAESLVVVVEVDRRGVLEGGPAAQDEVVVAVRRAIQEGTGLTAHDVGLVAAGALPVTTSGKVQRARCRALWVEGAFAAGAEARP
jgi:acyl-CoA synthetase (AMP-forming)/AMP-acid ligase II